MNQEHRAMLFRAVHAYEEARKMDNGIRPADALVQVVDDIMAEELRAIARKAIHGLVDEGIDVLFRRATGRGSKR